MAGKKYPKGHWMSIGIAIGIPIGVVVFFVADLLTGEFGSMFALGPAIGVAIGVSIGAALEEKHKGETRELTPEEEKSRKKLVTLGLVILVVGAIAGVLAFMAFL
jgi:ABC-type nickel/cobalt efflux system permease component RcnA